MTVRRARSIDDLREITEDHDCVLTLDAPLALALNRRTRQARLGDPVFTPKQRAGEGIPLPDQRSLFHTLIQETDLTFKEAATRLDLCLSAWEHVGEPDAILDWDRYDQPATRATLEVLTTEATTHSARNEYTLPEDEPVAIIDYEGLTALDREILPEHARTLEGAKAAEDITLVDPYHAGETTLAPFQVLPSTAAIVGTLDEVLSTHQADQIGVVLDPGSQLRPLIESLLEAKGIPYQSQDTLNEDPTLRAFLRALRLSFTDRHLTGRDVGGLLSTLDKRPSPRVDAHRLQAISLPPVERLKDLWSQMKEAPLKRALSAFEDATRRSLPDARALFDDLALLEEPVTPALVDAIEFYFDTFDAETRYSSDGVLLASAHENAYVDRALVIHLGIDAAWSPPLPGYPWIDRATHESRHVSRLERLLQAGAETVYLVQDTKQGKPVTPCLHLHELLDARFETFSDLEDEGLAEPRQPLQATRSTSAVSPFPHEPLEHVEPEATETLSASTLTHLSRCPRDWFMDELVDTKERSHLERGTLLHEFAEAYAHNHQTLEIDDETLRQLVEFCIGELEPFIRQERRPALRTKLRLALRNIIEHIDEEPPTGRVPDGYGEPPRKRGVNRFARQLEIDLEEGCTERWFENDPLGIHGIVDLVQDHDTLLDWKTTKNPSSLEATVRATRVTDDHEFDFQPITYLADLASKTPNHRLVCNIAYPLGNTEGNLREDARGFPVHQLVYRDEPFHSFAASRAAFERLIESNHDRQRVLEALGPRTYRDILKHTPLPSFQDKKKVSQHELQERLAEEARSCIGKDYKYIEKGATATVRKLVDLRRRGLYQEDLEAFQDHAHELRSSLNRWRRTRFPVACEDLSQTRHPDLILRRFGPQTAEQERKEGTP